MCGIVGILQYASDVAREQRILAMHILFSNLMLQTEERGKDATGVYQLHADGDWALLKKGEKASDFLQTEAGGKDTYIYDDLVSSWYGHSQEIKALVGHCRSKTVGTEYNNANNHPFAIDLDERNAILGVHNGTLKNHSLIFNNLDTDLERHGDVDSEAIFHMMYQQTEKGTKPVTRDMLKWMAERMDGAYAVVASNSRFPDQVVTFRDGRPMEYCLVAPLNFVIIASETKFIKTALAAYDISRSIFDKSLPKLNTDLRTLTERDCKIFDLSLPFPTNGHYNAIDGMCSEHGDIGGYTTQKLPAWTGETKTPFTGYTGVKESKAAATGITVDAEIVIKDGNIVPDAESHDAYTNAEAIGLCGIFTKEVEVADLLGVSVNELSRVTAVDLANRSREVGFCIGYAVSKATSELSVLPEAATASVEVKQLKAKKEKANNLIWELRTIVQLVHALAETGQKSNLKNLGIILNNYSRLNADRKKEILKTATTVFASEDTKTVVSNVKKIIETASARVKQEAAK